MLQHLMTLLGFGSNQSSDPIVTCPPRKARVVQKLALSNVLHMSGFHILNFLKPETVFLLKHVCKDFNELITDQVLNTYGECIRSAAKLTLRKLNMSYQEYFLQELQMSNADAIRYDSSIYYKIDMEIIFEGKARFSAPTTDHEMLLQSPLWGTVAGPYYISITLTPEYSPQWLRESGKPLIRTFGVYENGRIFGAGWGDKVILNDYEEIFLFLELTENEDTGDLELAAMIKDYSLEWTVIERYVHMMEKEYANLVKSLFKLP